MNFVCETLKLSSYVLIFMSAQFPTSENYILYLFVPLVLYLVLETILSVKGFVTTKLETVQLIKHDIYCVNLSHSLSLITIQSIYEHSVGT